MIFTAGRVRQLTHWGRVTHICVGKLIILGSDNGLSPGRRQAIIYTNTGILLIGHLGTNFKEILIAIQTFSFKKMHLKMSSAKWHLFGLGLNVISNPCLNFQSLLPETNNTDSSIAHHDRHWSSSVCGLLWRWIKYDGWVLVLTGKLK